MNFCAWKDQPSQMAGDLLSQKQPQKNLTLKTLPFTIDPILPIQREQLTYYCNYKKDQYPYSLYSFKVKEGNEISIIFYLNNLFNIIKKCHKDEKQRPLSATFIPYYPGIIFVETENIDFVKSKLPLNILGISGSYVIKKLTQTEISENFCFSLRCLMLPLGMIVRVKDPEYEDEPAQIVSVNHETGKVFVKMYGHIDYDGLLTHNLSSQRTLNQKMPRDYRPKPAPFNENFFNRQGAKITIKNVKMQLAYKGEAETMYWDGNYYFERFMYIEFSMQSLKTQNLNITKEELQRFKDSTVEWEITNKMFVDQMNKTPYIDHEILINSKRSPSPVPNPCPIVPLGPPPMTNRFARVYSPSRALKIEPTTVVTMEEDSLSENDDDNNYMKNISTFSLSSKTKSVKENGKTENKILEKTAKTVKTKDKTDGPEKVSTTKTIQTGKRANEDVVSENRDKNISDLSSNFFDDSMFLIAKTAVRQPKSINDITIGSTGFIKDRNLHCTVCGIRKERLFVKLNSTIVAGYPEAFREVNRAEDITIRRAIKRSDPVKGLTNFDFEHINIRSQTDPEMIETKIKKIKKMPLIHRKDAKVQTEEAKFRHTDLIELSTKEIGIAIQNNIKWNVHQINNNIIKNINENDVLRVIPNSVQVFDNRGIQICLYDKVLYDSVYLKVLKIYEGKLFLKEKHAEKYKWVPAKLVQTMYKLL